MFEAYYSQMQQSIDLWKKLETKAFEQACANVDEAARLTKESLAYASLLGAQWRKVALDSIETTAK